MVLFSLKGAALTALLSAQNSAAYLAPHPSKGIASGKSRPFLAPFNAKPFLPSLAYQNVDFENPAQRHSSLTMGFMEEFMTGRDDETRKAANNKYIAELQKRVERINELEASIEELGDEEIVAKTEEFRARLAKGEDINAKILEEAFAVVREAAW